MLRIENRLSLDGSIFVPTLSMNVNYDIYIDVDLRFNVYFV